MEQFYDNQWFQGKWLPSHQLRSLTGVSITWQELYPIYLTAWWANRRIGFYCDNQAVIAILSAKSSKIPCVMNLVWLITFQTLNLILPLSMSPGLIMSLLSVSFPDVTVPPSCTWRIASSLQSDPYIFDQSLTMQAACYYCPVYCCLYGGVPLYYSAFSTTLFPLRTPFYLPRSPP